METITSLLGQRDQELQESGRIQENIKESEEIMNIKFVFQLQAKFVKTSTRILINSSGELFSKASMVYNAIAETPGDFANQNQTKTNQNRHRIHKYGN